MSFVFWQQNADVMLIPTNDPTVDLPGSLPRNAKIKDVASIQQCQESLGALNQPPQNVIDLCDTKSDFSSS